MKRILKSLLIVGIVAAFAISVTGAFFSDTETSAGNVLYAGSLDLKVDNESYYNGVFSELTSWLDPADLSNQLFFNFTDVKPDDYGEDTISLHAENDYYACMEINVTENDDETCTTPENADDPTCSEPDTDLADGELGGLLEFLWWADDGDNVLEEGENVFKDGNASTIFGSPVVWTLADSSSSVFPTPGPLPGGETSYIGKAWCFGDIAASPDIQDGVGDVKSPDGDNNGVGGPGTPEDGGFTCDGTTLNNASQTDSLMGDITFNAYQARHNDSFDCDQPDISPTLTPTPTPIACEPGFATSVASSAIGTLNTGGPITDPNRTDPSRALNAPQTAGLPDDNPVPLPSFFSLGFGAGNIGGGNIVLAFANPIVDTPGNYDFRVFEVTGGTYPSEDVQIEASQDGTNFVPVVASVSQDEYVDLALSGLSYATHLRLTDVSNKSLFVGPFSPADAFDLDAVQTFCGGQPLPN